MLNSQISDELQSDDLKRFEKERVKTHIKQYRNEVIRDALGYDDNKNPFNDEKLSEPFIWSKKCKTENYVDLTEEKVKEIEQVRLRKIQREKDERVHEFKQSLLTRERESENFEQWAIKEKLFCQETFQRRSDLRIKNGRPTNFDMLMKILRISQGEIFEDLSIPTILPEDFIKGLPSKEVSDLATDVQEMLEICYTALEDDDSNDKPLNWAKALDKTNTVVLLNSMPKVKIQKYIDYWTAVKNIITSNLEELKISRLDSEGHRDITTGLATVALKELRNLLFSKTEQQLTDLQKSVQEKLKRIQNDSTSHNDPTYWETILNLIPQYKSIIITKSVYNKAKEYIQELQVKRDEALEKTPKPSDFSPKPYDKKSIYCPLVVTWESVKEEKILNIEEFEEKRRQCRVFLILRLQQAKEKQKINKKNQEAEASLIKGESYKARTIYEQFVKQEESLKDEDDFVMTPAAYEIPIQISQSVDVSDLDARFRLRKPRYFNHVRTGYEWSKYNQTHYDRDNPPPKNVVGYKFNIFYIDLVDVSQTPTWKILPGDSSDTVFLHFHAGPPYEDLRFRILSREWDLHPKGGFINCFQQVDSKKQNQFYSTGILQLHFNFKKYRYRR